MPYTSAQLQAIYTKIHQGLAPSAATITTLDALAAANAAATRTDAQTYQAVIDTADTDTTVAITAYQYFTGLTPNQAGLTFLVNSPTNPTDLNDVYYAQFDQANRYINFAQNLAMIGEAKAFFEAAYSGYSFAQTVSTAYEIIIGSDKATAAGISPTAAVADIVSRQAYFVSVAAERFKGLNQDLAVKAAVIGYIMSEAVKANVGNYSTASSNMLAAIDAGTAVYNTSLTNSYSTGVGSVGSGAGGSGVPSNQGYATTAPAPATSVTVDLTAVNTQNAVGANAGFVVNAATAGNAFTVNYTSTAGTSDVLSIAITPPSTTGLNVGPLTAAAIETLNLTSGGSLSGGGATNALTLAAGGVNFTTIAIFGSQPLSLTTNAYANTVFINGGGATGELVINAAGVVSAAVGTTIAGGLRNDTISPAQVAGSTTAQSIYAGGGGDILNLGAGHGNPNTLVYRTPNDSLFDATGVAGASGTSTPNTGKMDVVNNFIAGKDKVDISTFAFTSGQGQIVDRTAADLTALQTLSATTTFFQDAFSVTRGIVTAHVGADLYLYVDANKSGFFEATGDLVVKMVGLPTLTVADIIR